MSDTELRLTKEEVTNWRAVQKIASNSFQADLAHDALHAHTLLADRDKWRAEAKRLQTENARLAGSECCMEQVPDPGPCGPFVSLERDLDDMRARCDRLRKALDDERERCAGRVELFSGGGKFSNEREADLIAHLAHEIRALPPPAALSSKES